MIVRGLFLAALFSTIFCTAVNCYTWRLAYPLWRSVPGSAFGTLHREYLRLLGPVITLPHIVMFFSSGLLLYWRPLYLSFPAALAVFALDAGVVAVSAFWAGPIHTRVERDGTLDLAGLRTLVRISALRSLMMIAASALLGVTLWPLR